jgi:predicted nucleic acid-binding protein
VRWIVDSSAWSRRDVPAANRTIKELLERGDILVLSPPVLIELLRAPQFDAVAEEHEELTRAMEVLEVDSATFDLVFDAMKELAAGDAAAHRVPVTDLITAALAHQHACGVLHLDRDYSAIAKGSQLEFEVRKVCEPEDLPSDGDHPVAGNQRAMKRELGQLLHQLPVADAERHLREAIERAREAVEAQQPEDRA